MRIAALELSLPVAFLFFSTAIQAQTNSAVSGDTAKPRFSWANPSLQESAVSEINGKIGYAGGSMNSAEGHNFDGSITFPISQPFGIQGDALYSRVSDQDFYGGAGHFFWRNPEVGLLGLAGGYLSRSGVDTFQVGAEGDYYVNRFTFGFFAGVGSISYANSAPFIDTNPTRFVGRVSADWYALDNLRLGVSCTTAYRDSMFGGEIEYLTPVRGLALTAEAAIGERGYDHWLLGVRYYFGSNKSLRDRQRRDDPRSLMPQVLHSLGLYGAEFNRKGKAYLTAHPGAGNLSDGGGSYGLVVNSQGNGQDNGQGWQPSWPIVSPPPIEVLPIGPPSPSPYQH